MSDTRFRRRGGVVIAELGDDAAAALAVLARQLDAAPELSIVVVLRRRDFGLASALLEAGVAGCVVSGELVRALLADES